MQKESWASIPKSSCFIFCRLSIWNLTTRRWKILFSWNQHQDCFINHINITKRQPNCLRILETPYKVNVPAALLLWVMIIMKDNSIVWGRNQKFGVQWIVELSVLGSPSYHLLYFFEFRGNHPVVFFRS